MVNVAHHRHSLVGARLSSCNGLGFSCAGFGVMKRLRIVMGWLYSSLLINLSQTCRDPYITPPSFTSSSRSSNSELKTMETVVAILIGTRICCECFFMSNFSI